MGFDERVLSGREVRLFPSHHISSDREAELRATAALLAVASAVREFGQNLVSMAGGPHGNLCCYTEVPFQVGTVVKPREERPDGLLKVTWGKRQWKAVVEVKVGSGVLDQDQFDKYCALMGDHDIDALVTISNQSALTNDLPPDLKVSGHKKSRVRHLSWARLLSEAQLLSRRQGIADSDQQWILEEWVRYLEDPRSRIIEQPHMGKHWVTVLQHAKERNLAVAKLQLQDVVQHWDAFLRKLALRLRAKLGVDVSLVVPRAEQKDPEARVKRLLATAVDEDRLPGLFRIPDAAGDLSVAVLLSSKSAQYSIDVKAPTEGKAKTRIKWMLKQLHLEKVPEDLSVQVDWGRGSFREQQIKKLKEGIDGLLYDDSGQHVPPAVMPRSFRLTWTKGLRKGKGPSTAPVLEGIAKDVEKFYTHAIEGLRPYVPKAPQLQEEGPKDEDASTINAAGQPVDVPESSMTPPRCVDRGRDGGAPEADCPRSG